MTDHAFCRALARSARADCKANGIDVSNVTTYRSASGNIVQFEIWQGEDNSRGWISAHCSAEAKFKYFCELLTKHEAGGALENKA
jgi:hypothetical protein